MNEDNLMKEALDEVTDLMEMLLSKLTKLENEYEFQNKGASASWTAGAYNLVAQAQEQLDNVDCG